MIHSTDVLGEYRPSASVRGARSYYHSTDCYCDLLDGIERVFGTTCDGEIVINFRKTSDRVPLFVFTTIENASQRPDGATVDFRVSVSGRRICGWVVPDEAKITNRKPYDETPIWSHARQEQNYVAVDRETGKQPIEVVTALGVLLLNRLKPPSPDLKWLAGRLQFPRTLPEVTTKDTKVTFKREGAGAVVQLEVTINNASFGTMLFSLGGSRPQ